MKLMPGDNAVLYPDDTQSTESAPDEDAHKDAHPSQWRGHNMPGFVG